MISPTDPNSKAQASGRPAAEVAASAVSVIIPAHNAADTISDTLDSLLAQTHPEWEAIIVDDGSADRTDEIVTAYCKRDSRFQLKKQTQGGEAAARNAGLPLARSPWLLFLDADDWIAADHLKLLTDELMAHPELDAVHCGSARVALDGTKVIEKYLPPTGDLFEVLARRAAFPVHACIVRRSLVEAAGSFDTSLVKSPDWDLWQRIARMGARFGAVNQVLAFYRMRPHAASLDAPQMLKDGLRVLRQGHSPDPRVRHPHPNHIFGLPPDDVKRQEFYLLCWCAGLMLGSGADARPLLDSLKGDRFPELYSDAVAQCIFDAAPLPNCLPPEAWESLALKILKNTDDFLFALEMACGAPGLAQAARIKLRKMILQQSPTWLPFVEEHERTFQHQLATLEEKNKQLVDAETWRDNWHQIAEERERSRLKVEKERDESLLRIQEFDHQIKDANREVEKRDQQIEELKGTIRTKDVEIADLQSRVSLLEKERERIIAARDAEIADLQQRRAILEKDRNEWLQVAEELNNFLSDLKMEASIRWIQTLHLLKVNWPNAFASKQQTDSHSSGYLILNDQRCWLRLGAACNASFNPSTSNPFLLRVADLKNENQTQFDIQVNRSGLKSQQNQKYVVRFRGRADARRAIFVGFSLNHEPWDNLGLAEEVQLTSDWEEIERHFIATADDEDARIHFDIGQSEIPIEISFLQFLKE